MWDKIFKLTKRMSTLQPHSRKYNTYKDRINKIIKKDMRYRENFKREVTKDTAETLKKMKHSSVLQLIRTFVKKQVEIVDKIKNSK